MNTTKQVSKWFTEIRIPTCCFYIVCIFIVNFQSYESFKYRTQVCINKNFKNENQSISLSTSNFVEFVQNSQLFVDKSLLVRQLLAKSRNITIRIITAPRKWGKSLNLKMLEFFAQLPIEKFGNEIHRNDTPAFKYFMYGIIPGTENKLEKAPLLSMYAKFVNKYVAKYPVIYIDFSKLKPSEPTYLSVLESFGEILQPIFLKYSQVKKLWENDGENKKLVQRMQNKEFITTYDGFMNASTRNSVRLASSINFLSKAIHNYFKIKPVILHDHYDEFVHLIFFDKNAKYEEESRKKIFSFFSSFMTSTYEKNYNLHFAVMTGVLMLERGSFFPNTDYYECSVFEDRRIFPFYGFINSEVTFLLRKRGLHNFGEDVEKYYGQYKTIAQSDELYSPWAVACYINEKELKTYWPDAESMSIIKRLLRHKRLKKLLESLVGGKTYSLSKGKLKVGIHQCECLNKLMNSADDEESLTYTNLLSFFFNLGYLTLSTASVPFELQLANRGVNHEFSNIILHQHRKIIDDENLFNMTTIKLVDQLNHFIFSNEHTSVTLNNIIQKIFETLGRFPKQHAEKIETRAEIAERIRKRGDFEHIEEVVHLIFFTACLKLQMRKDYVLIKKPQSYTLITVNKAQQQVTNDTKPSLNARILIIEPRYMGEKKKTNKGAELAFSRISDYFEDRSDIEIAKYLEVRVSKGGVVEFSYKTKTRGEI